MSSVFCLVRQSSGQILVGGLLNRTGASNRVPLLRLNADLQWDETFRTDAFGGNQLVSWVRASPPCCSNRTARSSWAEPFSRWGATGAGSIVRLTPEGHVDGCFDPGLGLGGFEPGPVRAMALQPDGRILIGGLFQGIDTAYGQLNLARLLPQSDCDLIRVYLRGGDQAFAAATFPPGRTNYLEQSNDLKTWQTVETNTSPYICYGTFR